MHFFSIQTILHQKSLINFEQNGSWDQKDLLITYFKGALLYDFYSRAALSGGTTTIVDLVVPEKDQSLIEAVNAWKEDVEESGQWLCVMILYGFCHLVMPIYFFIICIGSLKDPFSKKITKEFR